MRKDYIADTHETTESEAAFIERFWTDVWENEGGPKGMADRVARKDEYRVVRPYFERLPKGARILDGGCGLGDWSLYLAQQGYHVIGMDISRAAIGALRERFADVEFVAGDIRDTRLPDASLDAFFSWGVFEHFEEGFKPCVDEAWRILKPGGYLMVSVPFDNFRHALRGALAGYRNLGSDTRMLRFYQWRLTRRELAIELARGGFELCAMRPIHKRQGVLRSLDVEFGLPHKWPLTRALSVAIAPFVPGALAAHMILAVAQKPVTRTAD